MLTPRITSQRRAPLISAPKCGVAATSARLTRKTSSESLRISRGDKTEVAISTRRSGNKEKHLPVDEVERVEPDARGNRRACGQAENDAAEHQRAERSQRQPIDRPPPFAQGRGLRARRHDIPKAESPKVIPLSGGTRVVYTGLRRGRIWATRRFGSPAALIGSRFPEVERHEDAVRIGQVIAKRRAFDKAVLAIERPRGPKIVPGTRFQAQP